MSVAAVAGTRFGFGANWLRFSAQITEERIQEAQRSLREMLATDTMRGKRFLDIGCGSGLFSLAARRLGAEVYSFDFDPLSVKCTEEVRRSYSPGDAQWQVHRGSVLDPAFMSTLGVYDVVYSWGVLHHTGEMWSALDQACARVNAGGALFVAIYNDQGIRSRWWTQVKKTYNRLPRLLQVPYLMLFSAALETGAVGVAVLRGDPGRLVDRWTKYQSVRGMSRWHDLVDWIGGFPFEVASPERVFDFCSSRGFVLKRLITCGGRMGCNEFVFERPREIPSRLPHP